MGDQPHFCASKCGKADRCADPRSLYPPPAALAGVRHAALERLPGKASRSRQGDRIRIADLFRDSRDEPLLFDAAYTPPVPDQQRRLYRNFVKAVIFTGFFIAS